MNSDRLNFASRRRAYAMPDSRSETRPGAERSNVQDITKIPTAELVKDLRDSCDDRAICFVALTLGHTECSTGSIEERKKANEHFIEVIEEELERRGEHG